MRRIAILTEYPTVNGGENSMLAVLEHLTGNQAADSEFEFCVLGPVDGAMAQRAVSTGVDVIDLRLFDRDGIRVPRELAIQRLLAAVRQADANLVHGNSLSMGRLLGAASRQRPCLVSTSHLRDIMKLSRAAISDLNVNHRLVAVSEATLNFHIGQGLDEKIGCVVHNGIDLDEFAAPLPTRQKIRNELGIHSDAIVLLTVGQIGLRKGLDTLAEAGQELAESRRSIHWLLAGERFSQKAESVDYERDVLRKFSSSEPDVRLHRLGYRGDVPALMQAADILVHGARQEPLGRVLLEAAASRLAIVATNVGGTEEILQDRESALLIPVNSPGAIASAVTELIENTKLRYQLASVAQQKVRSKFDIRQSADSLVNVWRSVL